MSFGYSAKQLVTLARWFKDNPDGSFRVPGMFPDLVMSREEWRAWFMECLQKKINRNDVRFFNWRKMDYDWWCEMRIAQRELNTPRLIIYWLPKDLANRFKHRVWKGEDA